MNKQELVKCSKNTTSVIIPVKNGEKGIVRAIQGLLNQSRKPSEIIIVDGHSTDRTIELASQFPVTIIYEEYGSVGGARQVGLESASSNYVAFTDADCIPEREWLQNLIDNFAEEYVGIGGGVKNIGKDKWSEAVSYALNSFLGSANSVQDRIFKEKRIVKSLSGCNCLYRKNDLIKIGGFNTKLRLNEDTELNLRLNKIGKLLYIPNANILHDQDRNIRDFARRIFSFGYGRARNKLIDLQVVPPILALLLFLSLFLNIDIFISIIIIYIALLEAFTFMIYFRSKKLYLLCLVPFVYFLEHTAYIAGFWKGIAENIIHFFIFYENI